MFARLSRITAIAMLMLVVASPAYADPPTPPANDAFANATLVTALPFTETIDTTLATPEANEDACSAAVRTVWYKIAPSAGIDFRASTSGGAAYRPYVSLFRQTPQGLTSLGRRCTSSTGAALVAGETYYVQVAVQAFETGAATISFTRATALSGRVTNSDGDPLADICVEAESDDPNQFYPYGFAVTNANGEYKVLDIAASRYRVIFFECADETYAWEWYDDAHNREDADLVVVTAGEETTGIDAELDVASVVTGWVTSHGDPIQTCVTALNMTGGEIGYGWPRPDGTYRMLVGGGGAIKVRFGCSFNTTFVTEWYDDALTFEDATVLSLPPGGTLSGIDADLAQRMAPVNDMFDDAAVVSSLPFSASVDTYGAGVETGEPAPCGTTATHTVWYSFTPDRDGMVAINTRGSNASAVLGVYTGDISEPLGSRVVACNHHTMRGGNQIGFNAEQGVTYLVQLGSSFSGGLMKISIDWAQGVTTLDDLNAPTPCAALCPYWSNPQAETQEERELTCAPSPSLVPDSWDEVTVTVPPTVAIAGTSSSGTPTELVFTLSPEIDHDSFICRATPDDEGNRYVATGANTTSDMCRAGPIACEEQVTIPVEPGESFVLRVFNWSDTSPNPVASYGYKVTRP